MINDQVIFDVQRVSECHDLSLVQVSQVYVL